MSRQLSEPQVRSPAHSESKISRYFIFCFNSAWLPPSQSPPLRPHGRSLVQQDPSLYVACENRGYLCFYYKSAPTLHSFMQQFPDAPGYTEPQLSWHIRSSYYVTNKRPHLTTGEAILAVLVTGAGPAIHGTGRGGGAASLRHSRHTGLSTKGSCQALEVSSREAQEKS